MTDALPPRPSKESDRITNLIGYKDTPGRDVPLAKKAPPLDGRQDPVAGPCQRSDYYPRASVRSAEMSEQSLVKTKPHGAMGCTHREAQQSPPIYFHFALPTLAICVGLVSPRVAAPHRALPFSKVKSPGGLSFLNRHYPLASPGHCGTIPCVRGVGGHATDCGVSCGACPGAAICLSRFHAAITDFRAAEGQKSIG